MTLISRLVRVALTSTLASAAGLCAAQGASVPLSPAKQALVQKALQLQQPGIEGVGNALANQTAQQVMQVAGQALGRLPAESRQAVGTELQADVRKFFDEISPVLRASAIKLAPATIGSALEEKLSEDELKVLIAWLESPVNQKYAQIANEAQQALGQKLVTETRPQIEPKLKALEQTMAARLSAAGAGGAAPGAAPAAAPKAAGAAPKAAASGVKK
jgi:hypothetical protein